METNELKAEVDKFLKKLQESVKKPTESLPTPKEPKATEGVSKPAKTQTVKASDFVKGKVGQDSGPDPPWATPQLKHKPQAKFAKTKPGIYETKEVLVKQMMEKVAEECLKDPELTVISGEVLAAEAKPILPETEYTLAVDDEKELEGFYAELLKVVNLLADTVDKPPLAITLFLKGDKYEFVKVMTIVDETVPKEEEAKQIPEAAMEAPPVPLSFPKFQVPLAYPDKIQVELSLGKDLVDALHQLIVALELFVKQQEGGIIS